MHTATATDLTERGISAIRAGNVLRGANLLVEAIRSGTDNDQTWLWLSSCVKSKEEQRYCLDLAVEHNTDNIAAKQGLLHLGNGPAKRPALLSEPEAQTAISASLVVKNVETLEKEPQHLLNEIDSLQLLNEIDSLVRVLVRDPVRLGRWLGYGNRLQEEIQAKM